MANVNKVILIGNITRDIELKYTPKGMAVVDLSLAINRKWKPEGGEMKEETTYVDVQLWGRQAELVKEYCAKGRPLYVEGRLKLETWEDRTTGDKRSKMRVICENLQLLGSRGDHAAASAGEAPPPGQPAPPSRSSASNPTPKPEPDDIPF